MYSASPRRGQPNAQSDGFTPLPSCTYVPRTSPDKRTGHTYSFFENGQRGIPLAAIIKYNSRCWEDEQLLNVASSEGNDRPKATFRLRLEHCEPFDRQKNVICQREHRPCPITVGKAAECAAQVVMLWQRTLDTSRLQLPGYDLCLDTLVEIGGSLQIHLGHRPSKELSNMAFSCKITKPETPARNAAPRSILPRPSRPQAYPQNPPIVSAVSPAAPAHPAPFMNQAGPSYLAQQASRNVGAIQMPFAQTFSGWTPQDVPYPNPLPPNQIQTTTYSATFGYDPYGAHESYPRRVPANGFGNAAYPRPYEAQEQFTVPTVMLASRPYPIAPTPRVSQGAGYNFYN